MARNIAVYAPNFATPATCTVKSDDYQAGMVAADMPLANLLTDEPSERSRILTHDPYDSLWSLFFGDEAVANVPTRSVSGLGLVNVNLSRFGKYRFMADPGSGALDLRQNQYYRLQPSALLASANLTGAVTDIDESPGAPDGLWNTPTTLGTEWSGRWSFPTPATAPATGAHKQAFVLWVKRVNGDLTFQYPVLKAELWENGVFKADLGTKAVRNDSGQILIFRWDAALLGNASGADVEVKLFASGVLPGSGSLSVGVHLGALCWDVERSSPALTYDSGWLASPFDPVSTVWGGTAADTSGIEPMKNLTYEPLTPWSVKGWAVLLSDDQADGSLVYAATQTINPGEIPVPDGYTQAGVAVAAAVFSPAELNFARGPLVSVRDPSVGGRTLGGQEYGSRRRGYRVMPVVLNQLLEQEGYALFDRLDWRKGKKLPVLVSKYPDGDASARRHTTLWCTLEEMPGLAVPSAFERHSWSGVFVEKL